MLLRRAIYFHGVINSAPSEMNPSPDRDSEVSLFPPLFSSYSFNRCHFSGCFQKSHYQAAWLSLSSVSKWQLFPLLFERKSLQSRGTVSVYTQSKQPPLSWAGQAATRHSWTTAPQAKTFPSKQTNRAWGLIRGFPANISKYAKSHSSSKKDRNFTFF